MAGTEIRVATFNASLNRNAEGELVRDLSTPGNLQAQTVAEIVQRAAPDIVLINEFDYVSGDRALNLFRDNYLAVGQNTLNLADGGGQAIDYGYAFTAPSNTGIASGLDLNNNGAAVTTPGAPGYGDDAFGFGNYPGQYGMAIYSKYEIVYEDIRTFQTFLWKDMPGARLPDDASTAAPGDFYSAEELAVLRLSSKSHWDIPVRINGEILHVIAAHPTPPTFDGAEDRNGLRNADEIRFLSDYVTPGQGGYIYDDEGNAGGLEAGARFVIMGDMNADPNDGDSVDSAALQLLQNPVIDASVTPISAGATEAAAAQGGANNAHTGNPNGDTADFADGAPGNLRADYVLPSAAGLTPVAGGVFWPMAADPLFPLAGNYSPTLPPNGFPASDHRLVSMDLEIDAVFDTLSGDAPEVIAHRGASGTRPEHTLEAYREAIRLGAKVIEPDLVLTKDGVLVDRHEPMLGGTTDVADRPEFADRRTTKVLEGETVTDWFVEDFTLAELKTLYARERIPQLRPDNAEFNDQFRIPTLQEVIDLVKQVEAETGVKISIIPETKHPTYFEYNGVYADGTRIGVDTSQVLVDTLVENGFTDPTRVSIQSFEIANLIELQTVIMPAAGIDVPLVQLMYNNYSPDIAFHLNPANAALGADPSLFDGFDFPLTATTVAEVGGGGLYSAEAIKAMADLYADVISPYKEDVYASTPLTTPVDYDGDGVPLIAAQLTGAEMDIVKWAHDAGVEAVIYTLRDEEYFSFLNPDGTVQRPVEEYLKVIASGFDGLFTDFPGTGVSIVEQLRAGDGAISVPGAISTAGGAPRGNDIVVLDVDGLTAAKGGAGIDTAIYAGEDRLNLASTVENAELRGASDADVIGNALGNRLLGGSGDNRLLGGAGADTMEGGEGDDAYQVDDAGDVIIEGAGAGYDRVTALIDYTLGDNIEKLMVEGAARTGTGNALNNRILANAVDTTLYGLGGNDALVGRGGDDLLVGGTGLNRLTGGGGADRFRLDALGAGNESRILDFASGEDRIELDGTAFALGTAGPIAAEAFGTGRTATTAAQRVLYDAATGALYHDADGAGGAAATRIAALGAGTAVTAEDIWAA
ncbi:glycerophosphodiester phosphodiesterase family protein [Pararoseomonas sp. SCSIO 73927]|uniref:glycerophosphodiester phosphodiesterase family protein n=1 Tax=Pararoseomonas sp. SCSIO 73927 TaxID=3114537 RepID=UPI0030D1BB42